jgi:uncharacterized protein YbbC (DUF1343 family)
MRGARRLPSPVAIWRGRRLGGGWRDRRSFRIALGLGPLAGALVIALLLTTLLPAETGPASARPSKRVTTGAEVLLAGDGALLRGQKVGIITNPTGVLPDLRHVVDVLHDSPTIDLVAVFGPEHGFRGTSQAGGSEGFYNDPKTGLPVYDTYTKSGQALADIFTRAGVDTILFDIQDVGARFYTFIWTLFDSMEAAALAGKRLVVLDRPNAITGLRAEGPVLHPRFATFVGRQPIAQRHGMTVGELARLFNAEFLPRTVGRQVQLDVVTMRGWRRDMWYEDTGQPWVPPSPNMPTVDTAAVYVGTCLFEGTNLSEGRGTTRPFELLGAPWIDGRLAQALSAKDLPGVRFREAYFQPTFSKYQGQTVGGVQVYVTDRRTFDPIRTALTIITETRRLYPDRFAWRADNWIDKLTGSELVRTMIDAGASPEQVVAAWQAELREFQTIRERYLLYGPGRNDRD